ncbi:MAG: acetyl-CoA carboxylase, carboxyltransferase subunit beta [Bacillota bacterium]
MVLSIIDKGLWTKCPRCGHLHLAKELEKYLKVCPQCGYHFRLTAPERLQLILDGGSFREFDRHLTAESPFDASEYTEKLLAARQSTELTEAVITGEGTIMGHRAVVAALDIRFIMASMGSVVGEKIGRAIETACARRLPLVIFSASGGARMQEGVLSLLQMAKTSAALIAFSRAGFLYVSVLTDPTTGGVSASFAFLGDIILAEPGALIGFAGPRVIEQTIRQKLPEGFQRAEFLCRHGFIDQVVPRPRLKATLAQILALHTEEKGDG